MATVIQIKRSSGTTAPEELAIGELAYTYGTGTSGNNGDRLFVGIDSNGIDVIGGKYFTSKFPTTFGTVEASKLLSTDSNSAIDTLSVGNTTTAGGQIKFNEGTNNGTNYVGLKAPANVTSSIELTLPSSYSNGQFLTVDGSGVLSFAAIPSGSFTITGDSGTDTFTTGQILTFTGDTAITTSITDNTVTIDLDDTAVTPGSYGSSTEIPTFTVDQQGRLTAAGTESISTTLDIAADSGTDDGVTLGTDTLTFTGGTGINTSVSGDTVTFAIDNTVTTNSGTQTLTNKTIDSANNTITITEADISDLGSYITASSTDTLSNKTIDSASNTVTIDLSEATVTGTLAEFNTAVSDATLVSTSGTETLTNKTLTSPDINAGTIDGATINGGTIGTTTAVTELQVDNININGNIISSTDTNGNISLNPNGDGSVAVNGAKITGLGTPTEATDAATKTYVDTAVEGLSIKPAVRVAAVTNLSGTYNNGTDGVGATLNLGTTATLTIDGISSWALYDGVLLINQTDATENGRYFISQVGDGGTDWILTRCSFCDEPSEIESMYVFVSEGTVYGGTGWVVVDWNANTDAVGTDDISFSQFSGAGTYTGGDGLDLTGTTFSVNVDDSTIEISADNLQVKAGGIAENQLATNAVTADKIASNAVTTVKITDANVTAAKLAATLDLSGKTVTLATGEISNTELANSTITVTGDTGSNAVDLGDTLTVTGGEGIDTSQSGDTLTIAAELASTSNKGVASFSSDNFAVSTGVVTVTSIDGGTFS